MRSAHTVPSLPDIVQVSDSASDNPALDRSGPLIKQELDTQLAGLIETSQVLVVPDEAERIREAAANACRSKRADLVILTGGTGFSPRDNTPEVRLSSFELHSSMAYKLFEGHSSTYQQANARSDTCSHPPLTWQDAASCPLTKCDRHLQP